MKNNITPSISEKIGRNLHNQKNHPIEIIKNIIYDYFGPEFKKIDNFSPYVNVVENFDKLLIPSDHPSRRASDTYYVNSDTVLRTHTSAHQNELMEKGFKQFLVTGDVYRKDEIDCCHYPVFHQMEGVYIMDIDEDVVSALKSKLSGLIETLFPNCTYRFSEDYFPFTEPSFEVEVEFNGKWLEVLGCGVIHSQIIDNCKLIGKTGWAFGLGLERLAMILFEIQDIRYFWTYDERFLKQFESGKIVKFTPYSKYPPCLKDISFWIPTEFNYNDFCEIAREVGGDLIENIEEVDSFYNKKLEKTSKCYRITYRSNDRSLTNQEVEEMQSKIKQKSVDFLFVEVR